MGTNARGGEAKKALPWYREEHIRARLGNWLRDHGYFPATDATTGDTGTDLVVQSVYGATSRISVRGYPDGDRQDEARQWFAGAVFDLARHRDTRNQNGGDVGLALALPAGFTIYTTLTADIAWLRDAMPFTIYWVTESGSVREE